MPAPVMREMDTVSAARKILVQVFKTVEVQLAKRGSNSGPKQPIFGPDSDRLAV